MSRGVCVTLPTWPPTIINSQGRSSVCRAIARDYFGGGGGGRGGMWWWDMGWNVGLVGVGIWVLMG